jgi:hypothetical protein
MMLSAAEDRAIAGAFAGGVAGVLFAAVVPAQDMMPMVAALYGAEGVIWGWVFHLLHSLAFGVAFGVLVSLPPLARAGRDLISAAILGGLFGIAVWVIFAAFVMPAWIGAVTEMDPPVPDWNRLSLVAHVVYGVALGGLLPAFAHAQQRRGDIEV